MLSNLKFIASRTAMALSLIGMVSMSVSAAGETELDQINRNISISEFVANLNANGKIKYDREEDGKPEVYYDFKDYQVLGDSLNTINKNEQALSEEYTRLYDLAENNRKTLISAWNTKFQPNLQIGADGKYINGAGTASIKGAIDSMPVHSFSEITIDGELNVNYPTPNWGYYNGTGVIDTSMVKEYVKDKLGKAKDEGRNEVLAYVHTETVTREKKCPNSGKEWNSNDFGKPNGYNEGDGSQWFSIGCNACGAVLRVKCTNEDIAKKNVAGNTHNKVKSTESIKVYDGPY